MAYKYKKTDHQKTGYWKERGYTLYNSIPRGFFVLNSNLPAPEGYRWYWNRKSRFAKTQEARFKRILVRKRK